MNWHDKLVLVDTLLGPFHHLWPLFVAPAVASLISDRTARFVPQTTTGSIFAAVLTAAPGFVGLVVIFQAVHVWHHVRTWHGVVFYWITPAIAVGLVAYALGRAMQRQLQIARLFSVAEPARGHLARVATELGARVLQIPTDDKECFVAGVLRPTVFVSRGALAKLDDAALLAALQHECAHMRGRDTWAITALAFLRDLAPWGHGAALEAFRATREAAADQAAARLAGPLNLATALIALARSGHDDQRVLTLPIARGSNFRSRMQALLDGDKRERTSVHIWGRLAGGLTLSLMLLLWPVAQVQALDLICSYH